MNDGIIKYRVVVDSASAEKSIGDLNSKTKELSGKFTNAGKKMTMGLTLPIVALAGASVKYASDLQETLNKVDVSFGDSAKSVRDWAKTSIKSMGLAQQSALDSAALFGDMGTGMGIAEEGASKMAMSLTQLSADLASFKNVRQDVAETALKGIFTGETESLKGLGIVMTEANLAEYALSKGIKTRITDMTQAEKVQLRYQFVMEKTTKAQGDFQRTSDGMANQSRMVTEQLKELSTQMGTILLPIALKLVNSLSSIVGWFTGLNSIQKSVILGILGIVAVAGPLLLILGKLIANVKYFKLALAFLQANPIVLGITAAIIAIMLLIKHFDKVKAAAQVLGTAFYSIFKGIANVVRSVFNSMLGNISNFIKFALAPINALIRGINIPLKALGMKGISTIALSIPKIPALATGTNNVQREGLAYLHQGEAVVPKKYNPAMGGGQSIVIEMGDVIMDGKSVGRMTAPYITKTIKVGGGNV